MRIAIYGVGGVGGYFGARLAEAGADVVFIARGAHKSAIEERGLELRSPEGDALVRVEVKENPADAGPLDAVILGVKAFQVRAAASALRGLLKGASFILTLQNGVEAAVEAGSEVGSEHVVPGLCRISSFVEAPGVIRHAMIAPTIELGEPDGKKSSRIEALLEAFSRAKGVTLTVQPRIEPAIWEKFLFIAPASGVMAVARRPIGDVRDLPESRALLEGALQETFDVALAQGVELPEAVLGKTMGLWDALAPTAVPSMARDIGLGRPSELHYQTGAVVRLGRKRDIGTPLNDFLYACLLPSERDARKLHGS
jgi:2-dehydropantoate 2-reductase